jgi:hypothetical protein
MSWFKQIKSLFGNLTDKKPITTHSMDACLEHNMCMHHNKNLYLNTIRSSSFMFQIWGKLCPTWPLRIKTNITEKRVIQSWNSSSICNLKVHYQPTNGSYPESHETSSHPQTIFEDQIKFFFDYNCVCISISCVPHSSLPPWFVHLPAEECI